MGAHTHIGYVRRSGRQLLIGSLDMGVGARAAICHQVAGQGDLLRRSLGVKINDVWVTSSGRPVKI